MAINLNLPHEIFNNHENMYWSQQNNSGILLNET